MPAGDIGVGGREIGYLFGQYKRIRNAHVGVLTGRGLSYGGSLVRTEATGYGLIYITERALKDRGESLKGKTAVISGSGNVAIYACEKAQALGAKVVSMSDSNGFIYDKNGIDLAVVKEIKEVRRGRIKEYSTLGAIDAFMKAGILFLPAKAANAGGVATSALEMAQSSGRLFWSAKTVDEKLREIMENIYENISAAAKKYNLEGNYVAGANIAGFEKVAEAMMAQGIV